GRREAGSWFVSVPGPGYRGCPPRCTGSAARGTGCAAHGTDCAARSRPLFVVLHRPPPPALQLLHLVGSQGPFGSEARCRQSRIVTCVITAPRSCAGSRPVKRSRSRTTVGG